jgi:2-polyprenyl-3-methyl-5-hydroxy-6-metoxy-1,4-benzoquinol methylase
VEQARRLLGSLIMLQSYSQQALDELLADVTPRRGWDFSCMNVLRQPVPWDYQDVVLRYLRPSDDVLDVGTGGGEKLSDLAGSFGHGLGIDADAQMVQVAGEMPTAGNVDFRVCSEKLETIARGVGPSDAIERHPGSDSAYPGRSAGAERTRRTS